MVVTSDPVSQACICNCDHCKGTVGTANMYQGCTWAANSCYKDSLVTLLLFLSLRLDPEQLARFKREFAPAFSEVIDLFRASKIDGIGAKAMWNDIMHTKGELIPV